MQKLFTLLAFIFLATSCMHDAVPKFYGKQFDTARAITVNELAQKMQGQTKMDAVVKGKVTSVCKAEGCWMNLENTAGDDVFVDWNHDFNVPINCENKTAIINGYAFYDTTTVEELKHFAKDEGKSQEEIDLITQPKPQLAFKATGVKL